MLRASAVCEAAGVPSSSLVSEGFLTLAQAASLGQGMPNLPIGLVPGHPGVQSKEELRRNILGVTLDRVIDSLLTQPTGAVADDEPGARDIVVRGSLEKIEEYFLVNELSDGLPFVPPTRERIEPFLRFTDRDPDEVLGVMLPDSRAATIWSIAVNGVMAGCRPEYMPVLVALVEAMLDPYYGMEHSGSTPGGETLIILNGPVIKDLKFNYTQGVMRDGFQANTSIGRFWRLYTRNIAGFLHHRNDKATFGHTWRVVVAENEDVLARIGWPSNAVDMGHPEGTNLVTVARYTGGNAVSSVSGDTPQQLMPYLADAMLRQHSWHYCFTVGALGGTLRPLIMLSPLMAQTIADAGWSKRDFKEALFRQARVPARDMERMLRDWTFKYPWDLASEVRLGHLPAVFGESDDPGRMVPIVWEADDYMVLVTGDQLRNNVYAFAQQGSLGYPVAREISLPRNWTELCAERRAATAALLGEA